MKKLTDFIAIMLFWYLICVFTSWEVDPSQWSIFLRLLYSVIFVFYFITGFNPPNK